MSYSIGEVSKKTNLSIHTLRFYDKEGLLPNIKRSKSGLREFEDKDLNGLRIIECLKNTGMPLKEIKQFLDWCKQGSSTLEKRRDMFYERKKIVEEQIKELQDTLDVIDFKCWYYDTAVKENDENVPKNMLPEDMPKDIKELYLKTH